MKDGKMRSNSKTPIPPENFESLFINQRGAFEQALKLLGPYPWETPASSLGSKAFVLPKIVRREAMKIQIRSLARSYWRDLREDTESPRVSDTLKTFRAIVLHSNGLAAQLKRLTLTEIKLLTQSFKPGAVPEVWMDMFNTPLPDVGFPKNKKQPHGYSVAWLEYLSKHTTWIATEIESQGDRGGDTNSFRQRLSNPTWRLISLCWSLFELVPRRPPSGTTGGKLHCFIGAIHQLVTGENAKDESKFANILKKYATIRRRIIKLDKAIIALAESDPNMDPELFFGAFFRDRSDFRSQIPPKILAEAERLISEREPLLRLLMHGPNAKASKIGKLG